MRCKVYAPLVPTAMKVGADHPLRGLAPIRNPPSLDLKVLDLLTKVGHVLVGKSLICRAVDTREGYSTEQNRRVQEQQDIERGKR